MLWNKIQRGRDFLKRPDKATTGILYPWPRLLSSLPLSATTLAHSLSSTPVSLSHHHQQIPQPERIPTLSSQRRRRGPRPPLPVRYARRGARCSTGSSGTPTSTSAKSLWEPYVLFTVLTAYFLCLPSRLNWCCYLVRF